MLYTFGTFEFDDTTLELKREGRAVSLEPQPARALALLVSRGGDTVTREEMVAHVWGSDTHVDFSRGLAYCLAQVRAALGDNADNPRFIRTLPRRGVKFIAPVQKQKVGKHRSRYLLAAGVLLVAMTVAAFSAHRYLAERPIVAVALFDNETGDSQYDRPVRALSDVIVDRLTGLGPDRMGVIGNAAALRVPRDRRDLKKIAEETGASFIVLAQLQSKDAKLSFLIQLIRLTDGTHLWTRRILRPVGDTLVGLEDDAAGQLEAAMRKLVLRES